MGSTVLAKFQVHNTVLLTGGPRTPSSCTADTEQSPEIKPRTYGHLVFNQGPGSHDGGRVALPQMWGKLHPTCTRMKLDPDSQQVPRPTRSGRKTSL